jgi:hypothetical protein
LTRGPVGAPGRIRTQTLRSLHSVFVGVFNSSKTGVVIGFLVQAGSSQFTDVITLWLRVRLRDPTAIVYAPRPVKGKRVYAQPE